MINWQSTQQIYTSPSVLKSWTTLSYRSHDLSSYLHEITHEVSQLLLADWTIITLYEESKGEIVASNLDLGEEEVGFSIHESIAEVVVQSGQSYLIEDVQYRPEETLRMEGYLSYLGVPIRGLQGDVIGTICSFSMQSRHYDTEIISTVERFAEQAAVAIDNYRLYQQQQQFNDRLEAEVTKQTMELLMAQAKLIEHERLAAIGEFTTMIIHEIRNPLTTIQLGLNYFKKLKLPQPAQFRLSLAIDEANRLASLLQEILSYAKPQVLRFAEVNVDTLIQELLIPFRSMPEAQERFIEYHPSPYPICIWADPDKLKQVLINLVRNACEAVTDGETIQWLVTQCSTDQICISIQNGGAPIPADVLPRLTQPFYSTKAEGTGLGLAIVKRIVEAHGGKLLIESSEATGTVFSVQLPLKQP